MRLDVYLVTNGFLPSREIAKINIAKGNVCVNGKSVVKPSFIVNSTDQITLKTPNVIPYVSRGGLKLEKALSVFKIDCNDFNALDVGASTGGFTDCLLKHGAKYVCAIDVGTNQLDAGLKNNPNVHSIENINIKDLDPTSLNPSQFDIIVTDLSFISLTKVIEYLPQFLALNGIYIALIKPQFEVGPNLIGKGGIVKDPAAHRMAIEEVAKMASQHGLFLSLLTWSPIVDQSKNIEYLGLFQQNNAPIPEIKNIVKQAFESKRRI
jgi:23S rRNA (cytidine1920-2'-O)/16S rRNA (cytidine1409-2'-O)-methyltransferase